MRESHIRFAHYRAPLLATLLLQGEVSRTASDSVTMFFTILFYVMLITLSGYWDPIRESRSDLTQVRPDLNIIVIC